MPLDRWFGQRWERPVIRAESKATELIGAAEAGRGSGLPAWFAQACQRLLLDDRITLALLATLLVGGLFATAAGFGRPS